MRDADVGIMAVKVHRPPVGGERRFCFPVGGINAGAMLTARLAKPDAGLSIAAGALLLLPRMPAPTTQMVRARATERQE